MQTPRTIVALTPDPDSETQLRELAASLEAAWRPVASVAEIVERFAGSRASPACIVADLRTDIHELHAQIVERAWPFAFLYTYDPQLGFDEKAVAASVAALKRRAVDVLPRPLSPDTLRRSIHAGLELATDLRRVFDDRDRVRAWRASLESRDVAILKGILAGHTNKAIAMQLNVSMRTVESRRQRLLRTSRSRCAAGLGRFIAYADWLEQPAAWHGLPPPLTATFREDEPLDNASDESSAGAPEGDPDVASSTGSPQCN